MRAVAYLRVSTDRQADDGSGLEVQRDAIRRWAKGEGHRVVATCTDAGVSGKRELADRNGLADAFEMVRGGKAEVIIVYRLDRLARDLVVQETLLAEVQRLGGAVRSTSQAENGYLDDDASDPSRALIRQVLGAVAQYERSMIALRLAGARLRKREQGGYAGFGSPPLGFRSDGSSLVEEGSEAETVNRIRALHDDGKSLRAICSTLEAEGHRTKRGNSRWHPTVVARVLARSAA